MTDEQTNIADPNAGDPAAPPVTQADVQAIANSAAREAVAAHMAAAAPATSSDHLASLQDGLAGLETRVQAIEAVVGQVAPIGQGLAGLIPGVGAEVATGIGLVPKLLDGFNTLLAEIHAAFGGKVAGHIQPIAPPPPATAATTESTQA